MVLCIIALPVFALLGLFSVKYRKLTRDSLECLFRTATFRKCESGLDDKIRSDISGTFLKFSPVVARFTYRYYKILSWIFIIILIWSAYVGAIGIYNYVNYGNCNGPDSNDFCIFDPAGGKSKITEIDVEVNNKDIVIPQLEDDDPIIGPVDAELTIIEFGCYSCPFTKKAKETVQEVIDYYDGRVNFQFKNFPIPSHLYSYQAALAANCAMDQGKYEEYHNLFFDNQEKLADEFFYEIARNLGLNMREFEICYREEKYKDEIEADKAAGILAGVPGTPTFFVNDQIIVGPKPFKTFKKVIDDELK